MDECPVCRNTVRAADRVCSHCETPLNHSRGYTRNLSRRLTALLPGIGHLWLGHLAAGTIALFGSFLSLVLLGTGHWAINETIVRLSYWVLFWIGWTFFWLWHVRFKRRKFVSPGTVLKYFMIMLLIGNGVALFVNIYLISNKLGA